MLGQETFFPKKSAPKNKKDSAYLLNPTEHTLQHKPLNHPLKIRTNKNSITLQQKINECIKTPDQDITQKRIAFQAFLDTHPYALKPKLNPKELKKIPKKDRPDLAIEQDFLRTLDPRLGYVPHTRKIKAYQETQRRLQKQKTKAAIPGVNWEERGPANVAGRTRALMFDPNDPNHKKVWAGGVSGGLWYNNDISHPDSTWRNVSDFWPNIAITTISYDPNNPLIFYAGTGEGWWNIDAVRGAGLWKSADGGANWVQMTAEQGFYPTDIAFYFVNDIVVRDNGSQSELLVATGQKYNNGTWSSGATGLYRSIDGGATFIQVLPNINNNPYEPADIEIAADNAVFIGTNRNAWGYGQGQILFSPTGLSGSWTIKDFSTTHNARRVEIACAPANKNIIYAVASHASPIGSNDIAWFKKSTDGGSNWSDIAIPRLVDDNSTHFTRRQAWYDLSLAVKPSDPQGDTLMAGGIDLHTSFNGGANWTASSHWYGGFSKPEVHADQHAIIFCPNAPDRVLFGNDGGVYYSTDAGSTSTPSFSQRNQGYNITQFYACAAKNELNSNYFLAGAQDNGTQKFTTSGINSTAEATGGDGGFCHIDQDNPKYQITSYVYSNFYISKNSGTSFSSQFLGNVGSFINPSDYDSESNSLYFAWSSNTYAYMDDITANSIGLYAANFGSGTCTHIKVAHNRDSVIFIGTADGKVYKIENAMSASVVSTRLDNSPVQPISALGSVSCIEIGTDENHILVTYSNYGVVSVWETKDGGLYWYNKEGNLPDMPIRWALYNPANRKEVLLATEAGIYSTDDISAADPDWQPSNAGLANVRCDMLKYRTADGLVLVATHGRGLFTTDVFSNPIVWTGKESSDWNNAKNWMPQRVPDASLEVLIPSEGVVNELNFDANVSCNDMYIENGRTVSIGGNLTVMGSFNSQGTVILNGASLQSIGNAAFFNLEIDNGAHVRLTGNISVTGTLKLTDGDLDLNAHTIYLGSAGTLQESPGNTLTGTSGIITTTRNIANPSQLNVGGLGAIISSTKNLGTTTIKRMHHEQANINSILRTYTISPSLNTNLDATLTLSYDESELNGINENEAMLFRSADQGTTWTGQGGLINPNENTITLEHISAFSDWTLSSATPLPFTLLSFQAYRNQPQHVKLIWQTVHEENQQGFEIEKSTDAVLFKNIAFVASNAEKKTVKLYEYQDPDVKYDTYYRLKQLDLDGSYTYSRTVFVQGTEQATFLVYPNPVDNHINLVLDTRSFNNKPIDCELFDEKGDQVFQYQGTLDEINLNLNQKIKQLELGVYIIKIHTGQRIYQEKIIKH
ncbi:MAG: T9SS type A sorting domain-containing protein [Microscillaceae bacterium]|nr:T9SS type A sorting domain-containing protein [Microscillaceae bacterium]